MTTRSGRILQVAVAVLTLSLAVGGPAAAQPPAAGELDRGGFTVLANLGAGIQHDAALEEPAIGLAGVNVGIGGFLTENLALLFRVSGTSVSYELDVIGELDQVSGVAGAGLQYWPSNRFNVEVGVGVGFWSLEGADDQGPGLILGAAATIFNRGKHNVQVGFEYAPAFTDPAAVHNVGFTIGYQFL